jgi:hypothetical protein
MLRHISLKIYTSIPADKLHVQHNTRPFSDQFSRLSMHARTATDLDDAEDFVLDVVVVLLEPGDELLLQLQTGVVVGHRQPCSTNNRIS